MNTNTEERGDLRISYDENTGQILNIFDKRLEMEVISFKPGHEVEINKIPLPVQLVHIDDNGKDPAWQCMLRSITHPSIGGAQGFDVFRQVVIGSACKPWGNHINPPQSLSIRYRLDRMRVMHYEAEENMSAGARPLQMPLWLDTAGALCAKTDWFGPETRMIQSSLGGCGPRSHVSHEEGPVSEVVPHLWNHYRRAHPGVQMVPGAIYTHPDGRWLWITAQRPTVGMHWDFEIDACKAQFQFHARLQPAEIIHLPEVTLFWGKSGREEMLARLNENFIAYEEPGDWFFHTTWFWLHWWQYRERGLDDMVEHIKYLHGELGLTGFGITTHDVRPGSWDCAASSLRPTPHHGGAEGMRKVGKTVRELGGKMFVWMPFLGMAPPSSDIKYDWAIKGEDGRPYESFSVGSFDMYHGMNFNHPEVQDYFLGWIRRYIEEFYVEGVFWDCGGSPLPPDFSEPSTRPWQKYPSETMIGSYRFMERVLAEARRWSPDFFMWCEVMGMDLPANGYSTHTGQEEFLFEIIRAGRKRLVYRSTSRYNLHGGYATVCPGSDTVFPSPVSIETYRPMAKDPMNKWLVRFVRENGIREALPLNRRASLCAGHVVVDPTTEPIAVTLPLWADKVERVTDVLSGTTVRAEKVDEAGAHFLLPGKTAYALPDGS